MKNTTHIDFTYGHACDVDAVLFPKPNLVISFKDRNAAEAAIKETFGEGLIAIRLYDAGDKYGA